MTKFVIVSAVTPSDAQLSAALPLLLAEDLPQADAKMIDDVKIRIRFISIELPLRLVHVICYTNPKQVETV